MGQTLDVAEAHRQDRLRTIQGLNLALLIHAEHQRMIGRVEIKSGNVSYLFDEERIVGELKSARAMGLNRESLKESVHGGFGDSTGPCRLPNGPVRSRLWFSRQSALQQGRDLLVLNGARAAGAQFIIETLYTPPEETAPPFPDCRFGPLQTVGDLCVA